MIYFIVCRRGCFPVIHSLNRPSGFAIVESLVKLYLNVEANSGFAGSDYGGTVIDNHVGYKKDNWYIQAGPAVVIPDGGDADVELSGKVGGSVDLSDSVSAYGEVSFMTSDSDNNYGTKVGLVYEF